MGSKRASSKPRRALSDLDYDTDAVSNWRKKAEALLAESTRHNPFTSKIDAGDNSLKNLFEVGMTPSKVMSIVAIVDEVLSSMGPDGIDLMIDQYKRVGMTHEDELVVYTVLRLLNESKILTDDLIAMIYRFGQALGIIDKDAELQYAKLLATRSRRRISGSRQQLP